jgi:hypothetical protein
MSEEENAASLSTIPESEMPPPELVAVMQENEDLLKEKLAEVDVRDELREQQLSRLITTLWEFSDPKIGHPVGRIRDISITVDEEETSKDSWGDIIYSMTFTDEWGAEYSGSITSDGGVGYFTRVQYDPETGMPILGSAHPFFPSDLSDPEPLE